MKYFEFKWDPDFSNEIEPLFLDFNHLMNKYNAITSIKTQFERTAGIIREENNFLGLRIEVAYQWWKIEQLSSSVNFTETRGNIKRKWEIFMVDQESMDC